MNLLTPFRHTFCGLTCDNQDCTQPRYGQENTVLLTRCEFDCMSCIQLCGVCRTEFGEENLRKHARNGEWRYLRAAQVLPSLRFPLRVNVRRSAGQVEDDWFISDAPNMPMLVLLEGDELRVRVGKDSFMKSSPALELMSLNKPLLESELCFGENHDLKPLHQATWKTRWLETREHTKPGPP